MVGTAFAIPDTLAVRVLLFLKFVMKEIVPVNVPGVVGTKLTAKVALEWPLRVKGRVGPLTTNVGELLAT